MNQLLSTFSILVLLSASCVYARPGHKLIQPGDEKKNAVDDAAAARINALGTSWRAKVSDKFRGATVASVKGMVRFDLLYNSKINFLGKIKFLML